MVEGAEQKLLIRGAKDSDIRRLYRQRRDLLRIHTVVSPLAEICRRLARVEMTAVDEHARPYFGEVADRVLRVDELFNSLREALAFAFEASLMIGQAAQNDTTRKLASWAAILAVPTAIAGIYGMNFEFMPELKSPWGYPVTLGVIVTICSVLCGASASRAGCSRRAGRPRVAILFRPGDGPGLSHCQPFIFLERGDLARQIPFGGSRLTALIVALILAAAGALVNWMQSSKPAQDAGRPPAAGKPQGGAAGARWPAAFPKAAIRSPAPSSTSRTATQ